MKTIEEIASECIESLASLTDAPVFDETPELTTVDDAKPTRAVATDGTCEDIAPLPHIDAAAELCDAIEDGRGRSALAVCNTVASSRALADDVAAQLADREHPVIDIARVFDQVIREDDAIPMSAAVIDAIREDVVDARVHVIGMGSSLPLVRRALPLLLFGAGPHVVCLPVTAIHKFPTAADRSARSSSSVRHACPS
jgi:hypothetical protein